MSRKSPQQIYRKITVNNCVKINYKNFKPNLFKPINTIEITLVIMITLSFKNLFISLFLSIKLNFHRQLSVKALSIFVLLIIINENYSLDNSQQYFFFKIVKIFN